MVWLLSGLVLALGLVVLVVLAAALVARLRRNQSAVTTLRISVQEGASRLRTSQELMRGWRLGRRDSQDSGSGA